MDIVVVAQYRPSAKEEEDKGVEADIGVRNPPYQLRGKAEIECHQHDERQEMRHREPSGKATAARETRKQKHHPCDRDHVELIGQEFEVLAVSGLREFEHKAEKVHKGFPQHESAAEITHLPVVAPRMVTPINKEIVRPKETEHDECPALEKEDVCEKFDLGHGYRGLPLILRGLQRYNLIFEQTRTGVVFGACNCR